MASKKNIAERYQQTTPAKNVDKVAKDMLSKQTKGEKVIKDKFIRMRVTEEEHARWNEYAKSQHRTLTDIIREMMNERIKY